MDLIVAWLALPAILALLCCGCGLLVASIPGVKLSWALLPSCGLALIIVAGQALVAADATAELTVPVAVALALGGIVVGRSRLRAWRRPPAAPLIVAAVVFAVFAAPIVLSGEATFAGFIRLDDTATWLALTDRVMEHGRSLDGLQPSSYEATLAFNLGDGYPVGVFVPLGVAASLLATDTAWLIQPYMAVMAVFLALALWSLGAALIPSRAWRAVAAAVAAQPALLYGYYLWGGIKEVAAAALIASAAALITSPVEPGDGATRVIPLALVSAALVAVLSGGGLLWLAPILIGSGVLVLAAAGSRRLLRQGALTVAVLALAAVPVALAGGLLPPTSSPLTDDAARGNLISPLAVEQALGIWPSGDFRLGPEAEPLTYGLLVLAALLAIGGFAAAVRARAAGPVTYLVAVLVAGTAIVVLGSPWVDGKALASASPALLFAALLGAAALSRVSRPVAGICAGLVVAGVLWSNALAYRDVSLAPRAQLEELERIGETIAGEGPTLMTEYQPYGVRHFLREAEPEGVSELRRRTIPRRDGTVVAKGEAADTDALDPAALLAYRTLVLRRSPAQSRPPAAYRLIWSGGTYEVWQRPQAQPPSSPRLGLGGALAPSARPGCRAVATLASQGDLVAARAGERAIVPLSRAVYPADWAAPGEPDAPRPRGAGSIVALVDVRTAGRYELWLGGSLRARAIALVGGEVVGSVRHQLNNLGGYVGFGAVELEPGRHRVEIRVAGADLHPGSGGAAPAVGPLALSRGTAADARLTRVPAARARTLCGARWDWIELARGRG